VVDDRSFIERHPVLGTLAGVILLAVILLPAGAVLVRLIKETLGG
jgi:hypothetical protein